MKAKKQPVAVSILITIRMTALNSVMAYITNTTYGQKATALRSIVAKTVNMRSEKLNVPHSAGMRNNSANMRNNLLTRKIGSPSQNIPRWNILARQKRRNPMLELDDAQNNIKAASELVVTYQRSRNRPEFTALVSVHPLLPFTLGEADFLWELIDAAFDAGVTKEEKADAGRN